MQSIIKGVCEIVPTFETAFVLALPGGKRPRGENLVGASPHLEAAQTFFEPWPRSYLGHDLIYDLDPKGEARGRVAMRVARCRAGRKTTRPPRLAPRARVRRGCPHPSLKTGLVAALKCYDGRRLPAGT